MSELGALLGEFRARSSKRILGKLLRRFAGAERGSRRSQSLLNPHCDRVCATKHAPRDSVRVLERLHGLGSLMAARCPSDVCAA